MKIALLSVRSGYIFRGMEAWSYELQKHLNDYDDVEAKVFSLVDTDCTTRIKGIKQTDPIFRYFEWYGKIIKALKFLYLRRFIPYLDFFYATNIEEITFALNMCKPLKAYNPDIIINFSGVNVGTALRFYRYKTGTAFISWDGAGTGIAADKDARTKPDAYVVPTPYTERYMKRKYPKLCVEMIPPGVDLDLFTPVGKRLSPDEIKVMSQIEDPVIEKPIVLSTSALIEGKRLDSLIQAMSKLNKGTLVFVGDGEDRDKLVMLGNEVLGNRFIYLGVLLKDKLAAIYRTADVFCLPTFHEPFGLVFIEAMASGVPVVAHKDEDREWMLGEKVGTLPMAKCEIRGGGILTNVGDIDALSQAIYEAANRDWGDSPRRNAERFSWDVTAEKFMKLMGQIIHQCIHRGSLRSAEAISQSGNENRYPPACICSGRLYRVIKTFNKYVAAQGQVVRDIKIIKCCNCSLARTQPVPQPKEPGDYHWFYRKQNIIHPHQLLMLKEVKKIKPEGKFLNIGCSIGLLLDKTKEWGYETYGCDVSAFACQCATEKGHNVSTGTVEQAKFPSSMFDVICMNHVLEHVLDLESLFRELSRITKDDGILAIGVPDSGSLLAWYFGDKWIGYQFQEHVWQFTAKSLNMVLRRYGFKPIKIIKEHGYRSNHRLINLVWKAVRVAGGGDALIVISEKKE